MDCPVNFYAFVVDRHWFSIIGIALEGAGFAFIATDLLRGHDASINTEWRNQWLKTANIFQRGVRTSRA